MSLVENVLDIFDEREALGQGPLTPGSPIAKPRGPRVYLIQASPSSNLSRSERRAVDVARPNAARERPVSS
jgi:hypothetical protein